MTDDDLNLFSQFEQEHDAVMAAISNDVDQQMPPADSPVWARAGRCRAKPSQVGKGSILQAPQRPQPPTQCRCLPADVATLQQMPRLDLTAGVVRCQRCHAPVPKAIRTRHVRWLRGLVELHQHRPSHVDVQGLAAEGLLYRAD